MKNIEEIINKLKKEKYVDFLFGIEEYDKLVQELDTEKELIKQEMIDRMNFMDIISIYKTKIEKLYFIRMEQYGYADEDAVVYRICFTDDINKALEECKEYMKNHDLIKMRKTIDIK